MPIFDYSCADCKHKQEHFVYNANSKKACPECKSENYNRIFSLFRTNVEYSTAQEQMDRVINPGVNEIYQQIGKEAMDEDAHTLENIFGETKVKSVLAETDD